MKVRLDFVILDVDHVRITIEGNDIALITKLIPSIRQDVLKHNDRYNEE